MKSKKMTIEIFRLLETNQDTFRRPKIVNRESTMANLFSPRQLEGELELAGIESCRRFLTAVPKRIHVGHIETVDDVEWPTGNGLDDWRHRPVTEEFLQEAVTQIAALVDPAEHEAMALVEQRVGPLSVGIVVILRFEWRLQVGRVIDGMRPGVGSQKLVM